MSMSNLAEQAERKGPAKEAPRGFFQGGVVRRETAWGYTLGCFSEGEQFRRAIEVVLWIVSVACFVTFVGLWIVPGSTVETGTLGIKIGLSVVFILFGFAIGAIARRGMCREVQVDMEREQLRIVWRNMRGETQLQQVFAFEEIGSVFMSHSVVPIRITRLVLRYGDTRRVFPLLEGPDKTLRAIWKDLTIDLHPKSTQIVTPVKPVRRRSGNPSLRVARRG
ncbi:hypothetical protein [Celeribacter litoreus]|uniref:hypothetical protein n=1 Tax=Celeribacter litoreus TaxID=2876714 RepID=UPI001CC9018D|nr:hypothetical protein [Celeribacter litoreus]MCA0044686.1 hypothetical protein [Celeribacter litoreus]